MTPTANNNDDRVKADEGSRATTNPHLLPTDTKSHCTVAEPDKPETFHDFLQPLLDQARARLDAGVDPEVGKEFAHLTVLLVFFSDVEMEEEKVFFDTAFEILCSESPNLQVAKDIRQELTISLTRKRGGFAARVIRFCGPTPTTAILSSLFSIFLLLVFVLLFFALGYPHLVELEASIPELHLLIGIIDSLPKGDIAMLVTSAFLGSIVSIVTRMDSLTTSDVYQPAVLYLTTLARPFVAMAFALFIYAALKSGLVSFFGVDLDGQQGAYLLWVIGFLSGFSERFALGFVTDAQAPFKD